jgi:hypothetical protein
MPQITPDGARDQASDRPGGPVVVVTDTRALKLSSLNVVCLKSYELSRERSQMPIQTTVLIAQIRTNSTVRI